MEKFTEIPNIDGLFWYYELVKGEVKVEPVLIDQERYGSGKFKGFNGRLQSWIRKGDYLVGPQMPPSNIS
ncbi:hypothetical protein [Aeromonas hydrophila]|uniref:hypothetical protein n=1 Tax=Aeromonas hydrophila TaxID=644 RepID=UPI002B496C98|nr:hypothetical protein [Aeromonas hydrophila]